MVTDFFIKEAGENSPDYLSDPWALVTEKSWDVIYGPSVLYKSRLNLTTTLLDSD